MELEQQLRNALQRDAAELDPVGPGPDDARRCAFRRKRRVQSGVVMLSAAALAGGTLAVVDSRPGGSGGTVRSQPPAPTTALEWRTVDGTVSTFATHFTSADGVTYALSTAPGVTASSDNPPQELYATRDGAAWIHTSLGASPWVADLSESKGVLYAVGTGPGSQAGTVDYKLATSSDGGSQWDDAPIPVQFTALPAGVKAQQSERVVVARGASTTVVIAKESSYPDVSSVIGANTSYNVTDSGVQILDASACKGNVARLKAAAKAAALKTATPAVVRTGALPAGACTPKVVSTRPWSDFGITDPSVLHQEEALVRNDGGVWEQVSIPTDANTTLLDVTATTNGFLLSEQVQAASGPGTVKLLSSPDGHTWTPLASSVPAFDQVAISGDRIVGTDSTTASVYVSTDAGTTWMPSPNIAALLPAGSTIEPYGVSADAGPLGFAALVQVAGPAHSTRWYLLDSTDGNTWPVTDLASVGLPANASSAAVTVGADHIDVSYDVPNGTLPDGGVVSYKLVSLLATPKA